MGIVARTEFEERSRRNGPFEMQVQFGFGQAADERLNVIHLSSLRRMGGPRAPIHGVLNDCQRSHSRE